MMGIGRSPLITGLLFSMVVVLLLIMYRQGSSMQANLAEVCANQIPPKQQEGQLPSKSDRAADDSWYNLDADEMDAEQIFKYLHWTNSSACILAHDFGGIEQCF